MTNLKIEETSHVLQFSFDANDPDFIKPESTSSCIQTQNLLERRNKTYLQPNQVLTNNPAQLKVYMPASTSAAIKENLELQKTTVINQSPKAALAFRALSTKSPSPIAPHSSTSNQSPKVIIGFQVPQTKSPSPVPSRQTTMTSPTMVGRNQSPFFAIESNLKLPTIANREQEFAKAPILAGGLQVTNSHLFQGFFAEPHLRPDTMLSSNQVDQTSSLNSIDDELGVFPFSFRK